MSKKSNACEISAKVRRLVYERDMGRCVLCHRPGVPNSHYRRRGQGGLGIEQNVVTMCVECHNEYDHGKNSPELEERVREYLDRLYPDFNDNDRYYDKWKWTKGE